MSAEVLDTESGMFRFKTLGLYGETYRVEVDDPSCDIANAVGTITSHVDDIVVDCTEGHSDPGRYHLGGVVQSLTSTDSALKLDDGAGTVEEVTGHRETWACK